MKRFFTLKLGMSFLVSLLVCEAIFGQSIFSNLITDPNPSANNPFITSQSYVPGISVSGIGRGIGVLADPAVDRYSAAQWNTVALNGTSYFELTLTPNAGFQINFTSIVYHGQSSSPDGPTAFAFRSSLSAFSTDIGSPSASGTSIDLTSSTYQGISSSITFRFYAWSAITSTGTFSIDDFIFNGAVTPISKFYRSISSGNWNNPAVWQSSLDSSSWGPATFPPAASDKHITVQATDVVTVSSSISLDETTINGTLQVVTNGILNVNDGINDDITISNNGTLQIFSGNPYNTTIISATSSVINIATGGKIQIGDGVINIGAGYEGLATSTVNIWNDKSIFEWSSPVNLPFGNSMANSIFFPNAASTVIPTLRISAVTSPVGGSVDVIVRGLLEVGTNFSFGSGGNKTIRDGFSGNSTLSIPASVGTISIDGAAPILGGTNLIIATDKNINIPNGITVPTDSVVKVSPLALTPPRFTKGMNVNFTVNGTIDFTTVTVTNVSGSVIINGYIKTAHLGGLEGGTISSSSNTQVNTGSTIEYNATAGTQTITGSGVLEGLSQYYNLILSGGGTKLPGNAINVSSSGSVKVTGTTTIVDASSNNVGLTSNNNTSFTMDDGRLILGTTSFAQPLMDGIYNITGGVIEFTNSLSGTQTIRSNKTYYAIEVTGTNVGNSSGNITLASGGSFTVKGAGIFMINSDAIVGPTGTQTVTVENGGTFLCGNNQGFNGFTSTLTNYSSIHSNIENIVLASGSTVKYTRSGDQPITNSNGLNYSNLNLSGSGNKTAPPGVLTVNGNLVKTGTSVFLHNNGTVSLNGNSNQNFAGLTYNNLLLSNSTKITAGKSTIIDSIKINPGAMLSISKNDTITLHSDAARTARLGQLIGGVINYNTSGAFIVERFISSRRAWRFLSIPVNTTQTIKNQWQEGAISIGVNPKPNYGTQITDNNSGTFAANGFDAYSQGGPSVKYYNINTDTYIGIASTNTTFDLTKGPLMTFVRGDRTATGLGSLVTSTVLRTAGQLFTGPQPNINVIQNKFVAVNNPYASAIDLRKISQSPNIFFYLWDPNRSGGSYGLGAYQTLSWNGTGYTVVPGSGSYGMINNFIESGQAFFVGTLGANTFLPLDENAKSDATFTTVPFTPVGVPGQQIFTTLYSVAVDGSTSLADGVLNSFDDNYNNAIDGMDARKLINFGENISIISNHQSLAVERRKTVYSNDTLFYKIWGLKPSTYRLKFVADQMNNSGADAYLEDSYLQSRSLLDLNGTTDVDFTVDANTGSFAQDRVRIVFEAATGPLPVSFTNVKAYRQVEDIAVDWNVENENNIKQYEVEKSGNGTVFIKGGTIVVQNTGSYNWIDASPLPGTHYYRIKSIDINGKIKYSKTVQVLIPERRPAITIYPNPVKGGVVHLHFVNQPAGRYGLRIINKAGQIMAAKEVDHAANAGVNNIDLEFSAAKGIYDLEITTPDHTKILKKIIR